MGLFAYSGLPVLAFLLATPFPRGVEASSFCPRGWKQLQGTCYGLFTDRLSWAEAELNCQSYGCGGHLASLLSHSESAEIARYIQSFHPQNVWIGLNDPQKNRLWRWSDQSTTSYRPWKAGEPNNLNNNEHCVEIWSASEYMQWNDENCKSERAYLCAFKL